MEVLICACVCMSDYVSYLGVKAQKVRYAQYRYKTKKTFSRLICTYKDLQFMLNERIVRIPVDQSCGFQCLFKLQNSKECWSIGEMGHTYLIFFESATVFTLHETFQNLFESSTSKRFPVSVCVWSIWWLKIRIWCKPGNKQKDVEFK